jgi:TonB family protein
MSAKEQIKPSPPWVLIAAFIAFLGVSAYVIKVSMEDDGPRRKNNTATVTLLKPPPPPVIKEKPPELQQPKEVPKKEEFIDTEQNEEPRNANSDDSTPAGDTLGVDADGGAGSDGFGLVGKKGGRSILAGGGSGQVSLLNKFAGYTYKVTTEIKKKVMKRLDEEGGIPRGRLQAVVRVTVDDDGRVIDFRLTGSSGNSKMDQAVIDSLHSCRISEPPPETMPRTMSIKIISQG